MAQHRKELQAGFVLHTKPYRDSSRLVEIFTREYGRVGLVAKGARSAKSRFAGMLEPFLPLSFSWSGQGELHTLTGLESAGKPINIAAKQLLSGFYLNELLLKLLQRADPHPQLFEVYSQTIRLLSMVDDEEPVLRHFEHALLQELGYGLILNHDADSGESIHSDRLYCYFIEKGPVILEPGEVSHQDGVMLHGSTLQAIEQNNFKDNQTLKEAKQLMRSILNVYLEGRPLKSRELYWQTKNL